MNTLPDSPVMDGETCVVSQPEFRKRDALLFDRIHVNRCQAHFLLDMPEQISFGYYAPDKQQDDHDSMFISGCAQYGALMSEIPELKNGFEWSSLRDTVDTYGKMGFVVTPSYGERSGFVRDFERGVAIAYEAALNNLPVVDADRTPWDQIVQFRRDAEATGRYRDFRLWAQRSCNARTVSEASDLINQKLDDYVWSIKKHGLQTVTGTLSSIFEFKKSGLSVVASGLALTAGGPVWAALTAGLMLSAQVAVKISEQRLALNDIKRGANREVAILHDARRIFKA